MTDKIRLDKIVGFISYLMTDCRIGKKILPRGSSRKTFCARSSAKTQPTGCQQPPASAAARRSRRLRRA